MTFRTSRLQGPGPGVSVIFGGIVWLITLTLAVKGQLKIGVIEQIFLLAPLVIIPLALPLVEAVDRPGPVQTLAGLAQVIQPFGAISAVASFLRPAGLAAAGLAGGWFVVTLLIALVGLVRPFSRGWRLQVEELCLDVGLLLLPIGGGWLVLSRLGANPLGFGDIIVLLTAIHFHYAAFAAPIITAMVGRALVAPPQTIQRLYRGVALGVIAGTPLVAAGITLSPLLELIGAIILATSLTLLAYLMGLVILPTISDNLARTLLLVSAGSIVVGMLLTYAYAVGQFSGYDLINIPQMARFHGIINALGFALCGLSGWNILRPRPRSSINHP